MKLIQTRAAYGEIKSLFSHFQWLIKSSEKEGNKIPVEEKEWNQVIHCEWVPFATENTPKK